MLVVSSALDAPQPGFGMFSKVCCSFQKAEKVPMNGDRRNAEYVRAFAQNIEMELPHDILADYAIAVLNGNMSANRSMPENSNKT
ncbi:hypothetical protein [Pandoraea sp. NPDC087047]|uniref:hypothetical protein n=1 Tax=Pandoraea sp. NPDC087047 TaxID=3364390 RepID=UPI003808FED4